MKKVKVLVEKPVKVPAAARMAVSETNLRKTARRVLSQELVSPEVQYIQRILGNTATQQQLDAQVVAVRKLPWSSIVLPD
jgi:hypothetical protein